MRRTGPTAAVRHAVYERSGGLCLRCRGDGAQIHHRKPRSMGGTRDRSINDPANLVLVCLACHQWAESQRQTAYDTGWLVHRWDDPADVRMIDLYGRSFRLDHAGKMIML